MQEAGRAEDKVRLAIRARKPLFALEIARMHCDDGRVLLAWVIDGLGIPKRCIRVEKVIRAG